MSEDLLRKLDDRLAKTLGSADEARERVAEVEKKYGNTLTEQEKRLKALEEGLEFAKEHSEKIEKEFNTRRFGGGVDELQNAIPDEHRGWIEYVKGNPGIDRTRIPGGSAESLESLKREDPAKYVAIASWMHARVSTALSAQRMNQNGVVHYREREEKLFKALGGVNKAAFGEGTPGTQNNVGEEFVPIAVEAAIGRIIQDNSVVRRSGPTVVNMTTQQHNLPTLDTNFTAYWSAEGVAATDSAPTTFSNFVALTAKKNIGYCTLSLEILQDSVVNLNDFVLTHLGERMARNEDQQALEGTTTGVSGAFLGLAGATGVNVYAITTTSSLITTGVSALLNTAYTAADQTTRDGGWWYAHPWIVRDALQMTTGSGGSPWLPMVWLQNQGQTQNLMGWPVGATSVISKARTSSTSWVYFGNPRYMVFGDRMGTQFDIDPYGLFSKAQVNLRVLRRTGIAVWVPSAFTICKGLQAQ